MKKTWREIIFWLPQLIIQFVHFIWVTEWSWMMAIKQNSIICYENQWDIGIIMRIKKITPVTSDRTKNYITPKSKFIADWIFERRRKKEKIPARGNVNRLSEGLWQKKGYKLKSSINVKKGGQHPEHHWNKIKQKETIPQTPRASASDQWSNVKEDIRMVKQVIHAINVLKKHNVRNNSSRITDNTKFHKRKT